MDLLFSGLTMTFIREFVFGLWLTLPLLLALAVTIAALGQVVGKREGWSPLDSFYWAKSRDATAIDNLEDTSFGFHGGIRRLIK